MPGRRPRAQIEEIVADLEHGREPCRPAAPDDALGPGVPQHVDHGDVARQRHFLQLGMREVGAVHSPP